MKDHYQDKPGSTRAHFRDAMQMKGLGSRMFTNSNPRCYCHAALCTCGNDSAEDWQSLLAMEPASSINRNSASKDNTDMALPKPTNNAPRKAQDSNRVQFLKVEHFQGTEQMLTIIKMEATPTEYSDVQLTVEMGGVTYIWGRRVSSKAYKALFAAFGDDETKWAGRQFVGKPEHNATFNQDEINVRPVPVASPAKTGAKR